MTGGVRIVPKPDVADAVAFLREEMGKRLVQVAARCTIDYQGRASSTLPSGERLLILKPDGTLLVHTSTKLKPVNWQPPGCSFAAGAEGGRLVLTASRDKPKEMVRILLEEVHAVLSMDLDDGEGFDLSGSEDEMQAFFALHPELIEPGFRFWRRERASGRGPMDLYGEDARGNRVVVEVKRRAAGVKEADQLRRYVERERAARGAQLVRGILLAPVVSETARKYLAELGLECLEIDFDKARGLSAPIAKAGQRKLGDW